MKFELYRQNFPKFPNIKFHENPCSGSRAVLWGWTDGRTDKYDEAKRRFSQFCDRT